MSTSRSLNKAILIGNLTRDPIVKETQSGSLVCTFGLATNSMWKDGNGDNQERTEFHNIVAWNKLAEICAQLLKVGMAVYIEGELRTRNWTDNEGIKHYKTEIKAYDMKLLDNKHKQGIGLDEAMVDNTQKKQDDKISGNSSKDEKQKRSQDADRKSSLVDEDSISEDELF